MVNPWSPYIAPGPTTATFSIGSCTDVQQGMICSVAGVSNPGMAWSAALICAPIYISNFGRSQFSEWLMITNNKTGANDAQSGPAVMIENSGQQGVGNEKNGLHAYGLQISANDKSYLLWRGCAGTATNIASGAAASFANGDVVRLEAQINASDVTLTIKKNGTTINTFVDNSASRFLAGSPGWVGGLGGGQFDNTGGGSMTNQWRNFNGGLL